MKKFIFVCTQLEAGGAQTASLKIAAGLRQRDFEIESVFLYKKRDVFNEEKHIHVLLDRNLESWKDYFIIFNRLIEKLKKEKPDSLLCFTHYANVLGNFAGLISGVKNRIASQRNPSQQFPIAARVIDRLFGSVGVYSKIIMVSESVNQSFLNYSKSYRNKSVVIPNGIVVKDISESSEEIRKKLIPSIPKGNSILINVGRLAKQKNQQVLIEMLPDLNDVHLLLIGDGENRTFLQEYSYKLNVAERVHLIGEISHDKVLKYLKASDVFVMPSLFEGMSNSLLEAIAYKMPVVASDIPSQREILTDEAGVTAGILVPPNDVKLWVRNVKVLIENREVQKELSQKAYERSKAFSFSKTVDLFEEQLK